MGTDSKVPLCSTQSPDTVCDSDHAYELESQLLGSNMRISSVNCRQSTVLSMPTFPTGSGVNERLGRMKSRSSRW